MSERNTDLFQWIFVIFSLLISCYFVVGGFANILINEEFEYALSLPEKAVQDYEGNDYWNIQEQHASEELEKLLAYYPIYDSAGSVLSYILTLMSFGIGGSVIRLLLNHLYNKESTVHINKYARVTLGGLFGLFVIVLGEMLPNFELESGSKKFYYTIAFLGGIYTKEFFTWVENKVFAKLTEDVEEEERKEM